MPVVGTKAAASAQGFGEFAQASSAPVYIESVFSTYLYTGNGSTQTITNGIDLSGKGGMLWCKIRNTSDAHALFDTARGFPNWLASNTTGAQNAFGTPDSTDMVATSTGFSMNNISSASNTWNSSGNTFASWTFRKQPKFFDVVTYTGNGGVQTINHSLGSVPGCIIIKATTSSPGATDWAVWHRSIADGLLLNSTASTSAIGEVFARSVTSTGFNVDRADTSRTNESGVSFVAYVFAHNAGGFGLTGTDNVISCGSYTGTGNTPFSVTLGYEPQFLMVKNASATGSWYIQDVMRGMDASQNDQTLSPNSSAAEVSQTEWFAPTATGFTGGGTVQINNSGNTFIYIAIRRGPMKTPTTGTSVFTTSTRTGYTASDNPAFLSSSSVVDAGLFALPSSVLGKYMTSRLTGKQYLLTNATDAEATGGTNFDYGVMKGVGTTTGADSTQRMWMFQRAPGFFDEVCYTGTGASQTINHNLGVAPELIMFKSRSNVDNWYVATNFGATTYDWGYLNTDGWGNIGEFYADNTVISAKPTSTTISSNNGYANPSGYTMVAYLFATCAGVSKVGTYVGSGTTKQVDCGFTGGARFVMIKRRGGGGFGGWYVWDSARGIVAGNDPYLLLNSTAAEVTNTDYVDTYSAGFEISSTAPAEINANGGTFIFLAIA